MISVPRRRLLIVSNGVWLEALDPTGRLWRTRRISWDGVRSIVVGESSLSGEAYEPMTDSWTPFAVDLSSGESEGGSYGGPLM